jgi:hypothetical protein
VGISADNSRTLRVRATSEPVGRAARQWSRRSGHFERRLRETQVVALLGPLHGVAERLTKNDADAEDLVAESMTRAWLARASMDHKGAFRAWTFRIQNKPLSFRTFCFLGQNDPRGAYVIDGRLRT